MNFIEPHVHMVSRTTDEYERMAWSGCTAVVEPAFWLGSDRTCVGSFLDYFNHLTTFEPARASRYGIKHFACIGLNPKEANNKSLALDVISAFSPYLDRPTVVGVGEIGFNLINDTEEEIFRTQLEVARKRGMLVVVHSPHQNKAVGVKRTCQILEEMDIPRERILLDHNTEETIEDSLRLGVWAGLTIYPTKLSPERTAAILRRYGVERMIISSAADWGESDPLSVPRTMALMRRQGFTPAQIETVVWRNPITFYNQSGRFSP